jgi:hypothetical protein
MPNGGVAFYNCGEHSGRSQPHKHLQVGALAALAYFAGPRKASGVRFCRHLPSFTSILYHPTSSRLAELVGLCYSISRRAEMLDKTYRVAVTNNATSMGSAATSAVA